MKKLSLLIVFVLSFFIVMPNYRAAGVATGNDICLYEDYQGLLNCNPEKKRCVQEFVLGGCNGVCPLENLNSEECLSCLLSSCGITNSLYSPETETRSLDVTNEVIQSVINAVSSVTSGSKINRSVDQNDTSCNASEGINCKLCSSSEHGTCVRNCINNEYVVGGRCYSDCYYEGQGYYLDSKSCNECLNKVCDRELREGDRLLEPSQKEDTGGWDFCDKQGVLKSMQIVNKSLFIAKIIIPLLLIAFGSIELTKAIIFSDDNTIKNCVNSLIKKMIIALIVFFVPTIVKSVFGLVDDYTSLSNNGCYVCLFGDNKCDDLIANSNDD